MPSFIISLPFKCIPHKQLIVCIFLLLTNFSVLVNASERAVINNFLSYSYDELTLPSDEAMGLVGGNYLFAINKQWYSGLGVYGAVKGIRGGFFTGGLNVGWRHSVYKNLYLDINGFAGGGGGGSAPQGGGLMLRGATEVGLKFGNYSFGLGYSYIKFPNGNISSKQISFSTRYSFQKYHFPGWQIKSLSKGWQSFFDKSSIARSMQFAVLLTNYIPQSSRGRSGKVFDKRLDILGIRWRSNVIDKFWLEFETGGAMLGNIDGFAQVFTGLSYENRFNRDLYWNIGLLVGAAGGGDVNTDGGLIYRTFAGLGYHLSKQWSLSSQLAWTSALEGNFDALTTGLSFVYHYESLMPSKLVNLSFNSERVFFQRFRFRPGFQRYSYFKGSGRKSDSQKNLDVDLFNLKMDSFINSHFYLTGQALGAFTGKAGGYAVGFVGPGYQFNRYIGFELLGGVAGGGGIAVGSGQIIQPMLNLSWPLNDRWELEASLGYIRAINDDLAALATNLGVSYRFKTPVLR